MRKHRGTLKAKELAQRLTGVKIPIFGVSWNAPEPQRKIVRGVLAFLEDRRVLYNPYNIEIEREVSDSVLEIRRELTNAIKALPEDSPAAPALRAMRAACREYLDRSRRFPHHLGFMLALGELSAHFGLQVAFLAIEYGLDIEEKLAQIVPPELRGEIDEGREDGLRERRVDHGAGRRDDCIEGEIKSLFLHLCLDLAPYGGIADLVQELVTFPGEPPCLRRRDPAIAAARLENVGFDQATVLEQHHVVAHFLRCDPVHLVEHEERVRRLRRLQLQQNRAHRVPVSDHYFFSLSLKG